LKKANCLVNILDSAIILREFKVWSYNELINSVTFDLHIKASLGLSDIGEKSFRRAKKFSLNTKYYENIKIFIYYILNSSFIKRLFTGTIIAQGYGNF